MGKDGPEKLNKLENQMKQLQQRIASEKAKIQNKERKDDTRRKILLGAYFMEKYENNMDELVKMIDPFLTRVKDRELFGLEARNP
jgi:hypothetical protein